MKVEKRKKTVIKIRKRSSGKGEESEGKKVWK